MKTIETFLIPVCASKTLTVAAILVLTFSMVTVSDCRSTSAQETRTWINPNGGNFSDDSNWDSIAPETDDTAIFDLDAEYQVLGDNASHAISINAGTINFSSDDSFSILNVEQFEINGVGAAILDRVEIRAQSASVGGVAGNSSDIATLDIQNFSRLNVENLGLGQANTSGVVNVRRNGENQAPVDVAFSNASFQVANDLRIGGEPTFFSAGNSSLNFSENGHGLVGGETFLNQRAQLNLENGALRTQSLRFAASSNAEVNVTDSQLELTGETSNSIYGAGSILLDNSRMTSWSSLSLDVDTINLSVDNESGLTIDGTLLLSDSSSFQRSYMRLSGGSTLTAWDASLKSLSKIDASSGSTIFVANEVSNDQAFDFANLAFLNDESVTSEFSIHNTGQLFGSVTTSLDINNAGSLSIGQVSAFGQVTNSDRITNDGGILDIAGSLINSGLIGGRGQFSVGESFRNQSGGLIAISGSDSSNLLTDFYGDIVNSGTIAIGGGSNVTFYDDVTMNPDADSQDIMIAEGSRAIFFGSYNGGVSGAGNVELFGDLRPGSSPGTVSFGGDVFMASSLTTTIELAGTDDESFDRLLVAGNLQLGGNLDVMMLDGFTLDSNQEFLIASIDGELSGQFTGLNEGDLIGSFGGQNLFISYQRGDGNDIALFTAVPEPGILSLLVLAGLGVTSFRRRRA